MKYSNSGLAYRVLCLFFLLSVSACGGLPTKTLTGLIDRQSTPRAVQDSAADVNVVAGGGSSRYLPVVRQDRKGRALAYVSQPNPYLSLQSTITQASMADYAAAQAAFKRKNYSQAEKRLKAITQRESTLSGPWVKLGDVALAKDGPDGALPLYNKALEVNKLNVNAYLRLAKVQRMLGLFSESKETYIRALAVWRDFPEAHLNLGILYDLYLNDPVQAQRHIEAYQFLSGGSDTRVAQWLEEIRMRTGANPRLTIGQ